MTMPKTFKLGVAKPKSSDLFLSVNSDETLTVTILDKALHYDKETSDFTKEKVKLEINNRKPRWYTLYETRKGKHIRYKGKTMYVFLKTQGLFVEQLWLPGVQKMGGEIR